MIGWDFNTEMIRNLAGEYTLNMRADPIPDVLTEKVKECASVLTQKLVDEELYLTLQLIPLNQLISLKTSIEVEIQRRGKEAEILRSKK